MEEMEGKVESGTGSAELLARIEAMEEKLEKFYSGIEVDGIKI